MTEWCEILKNNILKVSHKKEFDIGYSYGMVSLASCASLITREEANYLRELIKEGDKT